MRSSASKHDFPQEEMTPFNRDQIEALMERFQPIKEQIEKLKANLDQKSLKNYEQLHQQREGELQAIAKQLKQIDQAGEYG